MKSPGSEPLLLREWLGRLGIDEDVLEVVLSSQRRMPTVETEPDQHEVWRARAIRSERLAEASLEKLEALACGLGACPECWGEDSNCEHCRGEGQCGAFLPDKACFEAYVVPVIRQLTARDARRAKHPSVAARTLRPFFEMNDKTCTGELRHEQP